jgi:hypothetical protein
VKTFVLCEKEDKNLASGILRLLKTLAVPASAFSIGQDWRDEKRRLDEVLTSASHFVAVYTERSAESAWLSFIAGYALGSERPLVLFRPSRNPAQAAFLAPFFLVLSMEDLSAFLETEQKEWTAVADRREARRELLELGVSFRGESFADSVREGNAHAVDLFVRAGLPVDTRDKKGVPVLCLAVREGNRAIVDLLIDSGAQVNVQSEDRGNSPLMDAAAYGNCSIMSDLLEAGAALDLRSKDGQTALIIAVGKNDVASSALLLESGADPDESDKLGFSARKYAKLFHDPAMNALFDRFPAKS